MSHVACSNHGLHLTTEHFLQSCDEVDFASVRIFENLRVEKDLVGFTEAKVEFILMEELFVGLNDTSVCDAGHGLSCEDLLWHASASLQRQEWHVAGVGKSFATTSVNCWSNSFRQ